MRIFAHVSDLANTTFVIICYAKRNITFTTKKITGSLVREQNHVYRLKRNFKNKKISTDFTDPKNSKLPPHDIVPTYSAIEKYSFVYF